MSTLPSCPRACSPVTSPMTSSTRSSRRPDRCGRTTRHWSPGWRAWRRPSSPEGSASATTRSGPRASPSPSTATTRAPSAPSRWTCCPGSSRPTSGPTIEAGLIQRVTALNRFLDDLYVGERAAIHDGIVPHWLVTSSDGFVREAAGIPVPNGARCLVAGIDLVRDGDGAYRVLEDNLRNPSGISYVLENRAAMTRVLPGGLRRPPGPHRRPLRRGPARRPAQRGAAVGRRRPDRRRAHPRRLQLGLLRARLPRPADGRRAGRGPRPRRRRARRRRAHHPRPRAGRRHLPAHRRRLPRPGGVPARLVARRARPDGRGAGRQRHDRQRRRQRRRRRQGRLRLRARAHPLLPRRGADPRQRRDLPAVGARPAGRRARPARPARGEAGGGVGRLRPRHRAGGHRRGARGVPRTPSRPTPAATSPRRSCRCRGTRRSSATTSRAATSTCGRSCCRASGSR